MSKRSDNELSKNEKLKLERFELSRKDHLKDKYEEHDLTINVVLGNILGILIVIPPIALFAVLFNFFGPNVDYAVLKETNWLAFLIINLFISTLIHEPIHALTFAAFSRKHFDDVSFGFIWKTLTPYCSCHRSLKKYQYVLSIAMPCIILGIIPIIIGSIIGNIPVLFSGYFQFACAGGDLLILVMILLHPSKKKKQLYHDHPTEIGVVLFDK